MYLLFKPLWDEFLIICSQRHPEWYRIIHKYFYLIDFGSSLEEEIKIEQEALVHFGKVISYQLENFKEYVVFVPVQSFFINGFITWYFKLGIVRGLML